MMLMKKMMAAMMMAIMAMMAMMAMMMMMMAMMMMMMMMMHRHMLTSGSIVLVPKCVLLPRGMQALTRPWSSRANALFF